MASGIRGLSVLGLALTLAACGAVDVPMPSFPQNRAGTEARAPANTIVAPTSRSQLEPAFIPRVEDLVGKSEEETEDLFGEADLRRVDQGAQVWQYQTNVCVLFLFFYPDDNDVAHVSYVTSSGAHTGEDGPGDQPCVDAVTRAAANTETPSS